MKINLLRVDRDDFTGRRDFIRGLSVLLFIFEAALKLLKTIHRAIGFIIKFFLILSDPDPINNCTGHRPDWDYPPDEGGKGG